MDNQHPTDQALRAYCIGPREGASTTSIGEHLATCESCRRRAQGMTTVDGLPSTRPVVKAASSRQATSVDVPPARRRAEDGAPRLPDYELIRPLGGGGMGILYLYRNTIMNRLEALKVVSSRLTDNPRMLERFLREIQSAAMLQHRNIVAAYAAIRWEDGLILSMEYIDGVDLATHVERQGPLPVAEACFYAFQAARGLRHADERGMVHRDIKPANLMLDHAGGKGLVKILDFGLAKVASEGPADSSLTGPGMMLGTPDYVAPEQIRRAQAADIRADIYSLGCTLYFLLSGRPPFDGPSLYDILQAHHSTDAFPLNLARSDVPADLAALVAKMMAKDPEHRFQTPAQVADALLPFFKGGSGETRVPAVPRPAPHASSRNTLVEGTYDLAAPAQEPAPARRATLLELGLDEPGDELELPEAEEVGEGGRSWKTAAIAVAVGLAAGVVAAVLVLRPPSNGATPAAPAGEAASSPPIAAVEQVPPAGAPPVIAASPPPPPSHPGPPGQDLDKGPAEPLASASPPPSDGVGNGGAGEPSDEPAAEEVAVVGMAGPGELAGGASPDPADPDPADPGLEAGPTEPEPMPDLVAARPVPGPDGVVRHEYGRVAASPELYQGLRVTPPGYFRMSTKISMDDRQVSGFGACVIDDSVGREVTNSRGASKTGLAFVLDPGVVRALDDLRGEFKFPVTVKADWRIVPTFEVTRLDAGQWAGVVRSLEILIEEDKQKILEGDLDRGFAVAVLEGGRWSVARSRGADWLERLGGQKELTRIKRDKEKILKAFKKRQGIEMGKAMFENLMRESLISVQQQNAQQTQQRDMINRMFRR